MKEKRSFLRTSNLENVLVPTPWASICFELLALKKWRKKKKKPSFVRWCSRSSSHWGVPELFISSSDVTCSSGHRIDRITSFLYVTYSGETKGHNEWRTQKALKLFCCCCYFFSRCRVFLAAKPGLINFRNLPNLVSYDKCAKMKLLSTPTDS